MVKFHTCDTSQLRTPKGSDRVRPHYPFDSKLKLPNGDALRNLVSLYNFKNVKITHGSVLPLVQPQAKSLQLY